MKIKTEPMTTEQLQDLKKQIIQTYLFLISHTSFDPEVVEIMKLSALSEVQRRYNEKEAW